MVTLTIDNHEITVPEGITILNAAKAAGVHVPTLCYLKDVNEIGACRVCVVEVEGIEQLVAACNNEALDGMIIHTNSPRVRETRRANIEFLLARHNTDCTSCVRSGNCSLQTVANDAGIFDLPYRKEIDHREWDKTFPLIRDSDKCIHCLRCVQICDHVQNTGIWDLVNRSSHTAVGVKGGADIAHTKCTLCGQCVTHCPTGALRERDDTDRVFEAIADPNITVVVQIAPAVRTAWGEAFGLSAKDSTVERLCACLKEIGVDYVFDTSWSADLTIMEEGSELIERLNDGQEHVNPMFTSCCPGWVRYVKANYPEFVSDLSSAKSPGQMFGAITKSYFAEKIGIDPHTIFSVEIMPCLAKKGEVSLEPMSDGCGDPDVDVSLTVREVNRMIRAMQIQPKDLQDVTLDSPLAEHSGAGVVFGTTGGVMDAALRTAHALVTGENAPADAFKDVRGEKGWKEATFSLGTRDLKVAIAHGLSNAERLLQALSQGEVSYDFVEIMACPGGCVGGGGQPIHDGEELAAERAEVLRELDEKKSVRKSHENPSVQKLYTEYLGKPLSHMAHKLLHTDHTAWKMPNEVQQNAFLWYGSLLTWVKWRK